MSIWSVFSNFVLMRKWGQLPLLCFQVALIIRRCERKNGQEKSKENHYFNLLIRKCEEKSEISKNRSGISSLRL